LVLTEIGQFVQSEVLTENGRSVECEV